MLRSLLVVIFAVAQCVALQAQGVNSTPSNGLILPASSHHILHLDNRSVPFTATWSEIALKDVAGVPQATISATSYVREDVTDATRRPVMFAFNGGPGASSSPLHFGILGPYRLTDPDAQGARKFVENPQTLLSVTDLVFIDPVDTGFSRKLISDGDRKYLNPEDDAKAVELLIRTWLKENHRTESPIYIVGESYGGYRVAEMAGNIGDLNIAGLILISSATDLSVEADYDQQFVFALPSMAVAAHAHHKIESKGESVQQVFEEARSFAQGEYVVALQKGDELSPAEREKLADRMSKLIGLPSATIASANLRVETQDFLEQLLPGEVVGRLDSRVAAPRPKKPLVEGRPKAADDPALNMGASNVKKSVWIRDYLRNQIGVKTELDYISLSLDVNFAFDWRPHSSKLEANASLNRTPNLAKLMKQRPNCRLLQISGYYDLATPVLYQQFVLNHAEIPLEKRHVAVFPGGHTVYEGDELREQVSAELQKFIEH